MKLERYALVAEIAGAIAVVISLIYVGIQVEGSSRAVRASAVNDSQVSTQAWYLELASNRQLNSLFLNAMTSPEPLAVEDEYQFLLTMHAAFLGFQNSFLLNQEGVLDDGVLRAITGAVLAVHDQPGYSRYWAQRSWFFHESFVEYIDELTSQYSAETTTIYQDAVTAE